MAKSVWDRIEDMFKTDSERAQEKQEGINKALEDEKNILGELSALDKEYRDSLPKEEEIDIEALFPSSLGLKEITYKADSDEDIAKRAEIENSLYKQQAVNSLENKIQSQKNAYDVNRQKAESSLQEGYEKLKELYDSLRQRAENDALKRGLARSSIATNKLGALDSARIEGAAELRASYNSAIADIDGKIAALEVDKENALQDLDIKYATELQDRIAELKKERDKTASEYEKYNNDVRKQNFEYGVKRQEDVDKYLAEREKEKREKQIAQEEYEKKYGYSGAKQENYAKRYQIASDFYSALDPEIAADALAASPNMKYYLGVYYDRLLKALKETKVDTATSRKYYF